MLSWLALIVALMLPAAHGAEAPAASQLRLSQSGGRLQIESPHGAVDPGTFARVVGDQGTLRAYQNAHKRLLLGSWSLWGMGAVLGGSGLVLFTMSPLANMEELILLSGLGIGATGMVSLATGFAVYANGKRRIQDPSTWYTPAAAAAWLEGAQASSRAPRLRVRPVFTGNGLALAGSF